MRYLGRLLPNGRGARLGRATRSQRRVLRGVAILVPARYRIVTPQVISDGCCIEVVCAERNGGGTVTYRSTYLPPSARNSVLTEIRRCGHPQTDLVVGGDVNMCITGPRDEAEAEEAQALLEWAAEHGATA